MNEITIAEFERSVTYDYKFAIRESEHPEGDKRYDWIEQVTMVDSDEWFDTYEEAKADMEKYMSDDLGLVDY